MLKRIGNIVIIAFLLVATGGVPMTQHYCGSNKMSFSVYSTPKACCAGHCNKCHNVFKFSKINDDFEACSSVTDQSLTDIITLHSVSFINLSENFLPSPLLSIIIPQKFLTPEASPTLASFGNFRC